MTLVEPKPSPRPWLALWRREAGSFAQLPLIARGLFGEILKLTDDDGAIDIGTREPADAIAWALGADRADRRALAKYVPMLLEDGCLVREGTTLRAPNFARWQPQLRDTKRPRPSHDTVTNRPRTEREAVTKSPRTSHETKAKSAKPYDPSADVVEESRERVEESREPPTPLALEASAAAPPPEPAPRADRAGVVLEVFEHWKAKLGKNGATKLDGKRLRRIEWALREYGLDAVKRCIDGYARSPHHLGENDRSTRYDDIELFLRDAKHVEAGLAMAEGKAPTAQRSSGYRSDRLPPSQGNTPEDERVNRASEEAFPEIFGNLQGAANG